MTPLQISSFVGRERELVEVGDLLGGTRLLTLTGSGGCGKTRLALAAVDRASGLFGDGVGWVWLGTVSEEDLAHEAVAASSAEEAAKTPVFLAQDAGATGTGGRFYGPKLKRRKVPARATRTDRRAGLWAASEQLVRPYLTQVAGKTQRSGTA